MPVPAASWQVELDLFRGPLHALLDLIERRELPVTRLSLVAVADQYLALVRASPPLDLDLTAEFLRVASRLLLLKSLALLPGGANEPRDEAHAEEDLEVRLRTYRRFRDGAALLAARQAAGARMFGRATPVETPPLSPAPPSIEPLRLRRAALRAMARVAAVERAKAAAPSPLVPFTQVLQAVLARLHGRRHARFGDVVAEAGDVVMAVTMFLAVLELVRLRRVTLRQQGTFGPIELTMEGERALEDLP